MGNLFKHFQDPNLPSDYFRIQVPVLKYLGIDMYEEYEPLTYQIFSITLMINRIFFAVLESYELLVQFQLEKFSKKTIEVSNYSLTHIMSAVEVLLIYINRKKIGKMIKMIHNPPFAPDASRDGAAETRWIREAVKITESVYVLFSIFLFITIMSNFLECMYYCVTMPRSEWQMPYAPMSIGAFQKEFPYFEITLIYQVVEITEYAAVTLTSYLLVCGIMAHIATQLKIMANGLKHIKSRAVKQCMSENLTFDRIDVNGSNSNNGNKGNNDNNNGNVANMSNDKINNKMEELMRSYIKHHLVVLNLAAEMENLCNLMILHIFLFSVLLMCFILFFASLYPIGSIEFYHFCFYWMCVACQVASYCYWGNEITEEAEKIAQAAAEIDWPGATTKLTIAVRMIMIRAQRPVYITAGKFVPLSLETLMMMVKGSFSYFMVLKQTQDEIDAKNLL